MSKIFCDIGEVPKGHKRGSMIECAKMGKICYYGEKKVDSRLIEELLRKKVKLKESTNTEYAKYPIDKQIRLKISSVKGEIRKLTRDMEGLKEDKKKKVKVLLTEAENKLKKLQRELDVAEKKLKKSSKRTTKRKSKRNTKKSSKKKSKRHSKKHL